MKTGHRLAATAVLVLPIFFCLPAAAQEQDSNFRFPLVELWRHQAEAREATGNQIAIVAAPCVDELRVFYASANGTCTALFKRSGDLSWTFSVGEPLTRGLVMPGRGPLVAAGERNLYALDPENGLVRWIYEHPVAITAPLVASDDAIFLGDEEGSFSRLDPRDGSIRWRVSLPGAVRSTPLVEGDLVFCGTDGGSVACLAAEDGRKFWQQSVGGAVRSGFAVCGGRLVFGSNDDYIYCLDVVNGDLRWRTRTAGAVFGIPVCDDRYLYIASADRTIRSHRISNGHARDESPVSLTANLRVAPLLAGDLLVYPQRLNLQATSTELLASVGSFILPSEISSPPTVDSDGLTLYYGCGDGLLLALAPQGAHRQVDELRDLREPERQILIPEGEPVAAPDDQPAEAAEFPDTAESEPVFETVVEEQIPVEDEPTGEETASEDETPVETAPAMEETAEQQPTPSETEIPATEVAPSEEETVEQPPTETEEIAPDVAPSDEETVEQPPVETEAITPEDAIARARELMAENHLERAAAMWREALRERAETTYTVVIGLFCRREAIYTIMDALGDEAELIIFDRQRGDTTCYFICTGFFDTRNAALEHLRSLPEIIQRQNPAAFRLDSFIPQ